MSKSPKKTLFEFSLEESEQSTKRRKALSEYLWQEYSYLAHERSKLSLEIKEALLSAVHEFEFKNWYRVIEQQYANNPLSTQGSRKQTGGRFNYGEIEAIKFPVFSCLYIASDKETANKEKFSFGKKKKEKLKREEFGGTIGSFLTSRICGKIKSVIDVTDKSCLKKFVDVIKKIEFSDSLKKLARNLHLADRKSIKTTTQLQKFICIPDYRYDPIIFKVPSISQQFGQIVKTIGIQGILYESKYTSKHTPKQCLAVFPSNFHNRDGFVKLMDPIPDKAVGKIDKTTWREFI